MEHTRKREVEGENERCLLPSAAQTIALSVWLNRDSERSTVDNAPV